MPMALAVTFDARAISENDALFGKSLRRDPMVRQRSAGHM
jgi:hypothetical protein